MSLRVDVFLVRPDDPMVVLDVPAGHSDLAGAERWRTTVWGSDAVRALGATHLPVLAVADSLTVGPDRVTDLVAECALIRRNLESVTSATRGTTPHTRAARRLGQCLAAIEDAAERARRLGGGVVVW